MSFLFIANKREWDRNLILLNRFRRPTPIRLTRIEKLSLKRVFSSVIFCQYEVRLVRMHDVSASTLNESAFVFNLLYIKFIIFSIKIENMVPQQSRQ